MKLSSVFVGVLVVVPLGLGPVSGQQAVTSGWAPVAGGGNTSAVTRSTEAATQNLGAVVLSALLTEDAQPIDSGIVWHVFRDRAEADGKLPLVRQLKDATPTVRLEPGEYLINAAFGRATLTRKIKVDAAKPSQEKFVLNAGGLRLRALLASGEAATASTISYDVLSEERDQSGNRVKILAGAKPGSVVRLNAGTYQIVSTYGDANARVRTEATVEPGKLSDVEVKHVGSKMTFKLVARAGGEAVADVAWSIVDARAETVKETVGALPTHVLAAGKYAVLARHQGKTYRAEFVTKSGEHAVIEVVAR